MEAGLEAVRAERRTLAMDIARGEPAAAKRNEALNARQVELMASLDLLLVVRGVAQEKLAETQAVEADAVAEARRVEGRGIAHELLEQSRRADKAMREAASALAQREALARRLSGHGASLNALAPAIAWPRINAELAKKHFLEYLGFALQFAPLQPNETAIRAQLARIGVGTGKLADAGGTSLLDRIEMDLGLWEGERKVEAGVAAAGVGMNGWRVTNIQGSADAYNGDWLLRAVVRVGPGSVRQAVDAVRHQ
jgi:hypothetical protein